MSFFYANQEEILNQNLIEMKNKLKISFEFFFPKNEEMKKIFWKSINILKKFNPSFISITCSSKFDRFYETLNIIKLIKEKTKIEVAPHMICINNTPKILKKRSEEYLNNGINHIVALRGDIPKFSKIYNVSYAVDLIKILKKVGNFDISVASYPEMHPESINLQSDLINFKKKVDAGANRSITQFFFNAESYLRFRDRCVSSNINIDIIPGILPIINFEQIKKFSYLSNVKIPFWIKNIFKKLKNNKESSKMIGFYIMMNIIKILLKEGVRNFHFYTLNNFENVLSYCNMMGINTK